VVLVLEAEGPQQRSPDYNGERLEPVRKELTELPFSYLVRFARLSRVVVLLHSI
jgi:hypothetical protein